MVKSIVLSDDYKGVEKRLLEMVSDIEKFMAEDYARDDIQSLKERLQKAQVLLSTTGNIMQAATGLYSTAKGLAADVILQTPMYADAKIDFIRAKMSGMLAKWEALHIRAERNCKELVTTCDVMRTLVSAEKEQMRNFDKT